MHLLEVFRGSHNGNIVDETMLYFSLNDTRIRAQFKSGYS
jgi:hypothetical protein